MDAPNHSHRELLLRSRIFAGLDAAEAEALAESGRVVRFATDAPLVKHGDPAQALYVLLKGTCDVFGRGSDRTDVLLATAKAGEVLGEMALVTRGARAATVIAAEPVVAWALPAEVFEELVQTGDVRGLHLLRAIGRDLCSRFRESVVDSATLQDELRRRGLAGVSRWGAV